MTYKSANDSNTIPGSDIGKQGLGTAWRTTVCRVTRRGLSEEGTFEPSLRHWRRELSAALWTEDSTVPSPPPSDLVPLTWLMQLESLRLSLMGL